MQQEEEAVFPDCPTSQDTAAAYSDCSGSRGRGRAAAFPD